MEENESYIDWFIEEAKKQDISLSLVIREQLQIGIETGMPVINVQYKRVSLPDFVVIRTIEPTLQTFFESFGVETFNSAETAFICNHKSLTHMKMNELEIPMVPTFFTTKQHMPTISPLSYPVIVKEAMGRSGKQVYFVENNDAWERVKAQVETDDILIQSASVQLGKDVRVFVIGKEIIASVLRRNRHDFRANYRLGGEAIPYTLSKEEEKMVRKIVEHFNFGLVGIDFLIDHRGQLLFNEIEDVVGSRILSKVSNINLLKKYVAYIKNSVQKKQDMKSLV